MKYAQQSIGKEKAIELANSGWWEGQDSRKLVQFQLFTEELSMPFDVFQKALEESLGRPVWTHELGMNIDAIMQEFLGEKEAPTLEEIINLIPEQKRIIVNIGGAK